MKIDILTLFPDSVSHVLGESILGRAAKKGILEIQCHQIREYTENKQMQVDDYPYGGGWGCVMMAQPLFSCLEAVVKQGALQDRTRVLYMSPQGKPFVQEDARRYVQEYDRLIMICGHYEGIDQRFIDSCVDEEVSIGDFVLTGGEIPAMAVADAVCRLVPGVLSDEECFTGESHWNGLLEYPQYTRPASWNDMEVPPVLLSGNHADITYWRRKQSILNTMHKRPDLFAVFEPEDKMDIRILEEIRQMQSEETHKRSFDFRRAEEADVSAIMAIILQAQETLRQQGINQWQDQYPTAQSFMEDIQRGECWLCIYKEQVAGVLTISRTPDAAYSEIDGTWLQDMPWTTIHRFAVAKEFYGTGAGNEMLAFAEALTLGYGYGSIRVDTHPENFRMQNVLQRNGFLPCGTVYLDLSLPDRKARLAFEKLL